MGTDVQSQESTKCKKCGADKRTYLCGVKSGKPYKQSFCTACDYARRFPNKTSQDCQRVRSYSAEQSPDAPPARYRLPLDLTKNPKSAEWSRSNPEKRRAQKMVETAVRTGKLPRSPCERCGSLKAEAHHEDYSKPLDVSWLCRKHHLARHRELKELTE
jgi:hypothetical protein